MDKWYQFQSNIYIKFQKDLTKIRITIKYMANNLTGLT
ncbi:Uncharacterised protein [Sphingobacterium thalpophilum]|uniref:Uncharacterized protein n=1 Tax=Sphingobacterium thalpophilum TaxID=259 RepID=A0A4U9W7X0_9SPHI|nr:Uncharacterised protein [Sphingobacterium thalpophilum]